MKRLIALILILTAPEQSNADTVYIRDIIYVPLRGGQSQEHRILHRGLKSGLKLERLETNEITGYARVRTENGLEGWLENQYLVTEPIAIDRLNSITTELEELQGKHQSVLEQLQDITDSNKTMSMEIANLTEVKAELVREIEEISLLAADTIDIDKKNSVLSDNHKKLAKRVNDLTLANQTLQNKDSQKWFLGGSASVLLGLLFGLWIGRIIYQRNKGGWG